MAFDGSILTTATAGAFAGAAFSDTFSISGGDVDMVRLELTAGRLYQVDIDNGFAGDFYLRIFDAIGNEVKANDDGFHSDDNEVFSLAPFVEFTPNYTGTYYFAISPYYLQSYDPNTTSGRYVPENPMPLTNGTLTVTNLGTNFWPGPGAINTIIAEDANDETDNLRDEDRSLRVTYFGSIDFPADVDIARMDLSKGDVIVIDVNGLEGNGTVLRVFDAGGTQIGFDDLSGVLSDPELIFAAPAAGSYYVGTSGDGNASYDALTGAGTVAGAEGDFEVIVHRNPTLIGSVVSNVINGSAADDYIVSLAGEDIVDGNDGNDTLAGGDGQDILRGGNGRDVLYGEQGDDSLFGDAGSDVLMGGIGNDSLDGGADDDLLDGGAGDDTLIGGTGADTMLGGAGNDTYVVDNVGNQVFETTTTASLIDAGGVDTVQSSLTFSLDAYAGVRFIENLTLTGAVSINGTGNALANVLTGNAGNNTLDGGLGNDTLNGGAGTDGMSGGGGDDTYIVDNVGDRVYETTTPTSGIDTGGVDNVLSSVTMSLNAYAAVRFVENLTLTGATHINGDGNDLDNVLTGNAGNNTLNGGLGNDTMGGGAGNDIYVVDSINDQVFETTTLASLIDAGGIDTIQSSVALNLDANAGLRFVERLTLTGAANIDATGNALGNVLLGNSGNNTLDGGLGIDLMVGGAGNDTYVVDNAGDRVFETTTVATQIDAGGVDTMLSSISTSLDAYIGVRFVENMTLTGTGNLVAVGNALANELIGNTGNNTLNGGLGADIMGGGLGNDIYVVDNVGDQVFETTTISSGLDTGGVDTIQSSVTLNLDANAGIRFVERLTLTGTGNINGTGNGLANVMIGNSGNNILDGGLGADIMGGGAGNDTYIVDSIGDFVFETTTISILTDAGGVDTIVSSLAMNLDDTVGLRFVENLTLTGTANIDGMGNALANVLTGNSGNNTLNGGLGNDTMIGGLGADTFVFSTTLGASNVDQITGFSVVDDTIRLDDAIFVGVAPGVLAGTAFAANLTGEAADASDRIIYETDTGGLFYDVDGLGGVGRVQFATLSTGLALTNADFFVF